MNWLHVAAVHSQDSYTFLGIPFSIMGVRLLSQNASALIPRIVLEFLGITSKSREYACLTLHAGISHSPDCCTIRGTHAHNTRLAVFWHPSFPGMSHNSWEFSPNSWEHCTLHICTLSRSLYFVPGDRIPRNDYHNPEEFFPGFSEQVSQSWERMQNTTNPAILF